MKLLIATRNQHKLKEFKSLLSNLNFKIVNLDQISSIPKTFNIKETGKSFKQNAVLKAVGFGQIAKSLTLADDSGLMVDHLNGQPGVHSHRFAKHGHQQARNHILQLLKVVPKPQRTAQFKCTLALFDPSSNKIKTFTGISRGYISLHEKGNHGFGYDSIFLSKDLNKTFAEIPDSKKNQVSHRARAFKKLVNYFKIHDYD